jgi:hypothetical protein
MSLRYLAEAVYHWSRQVEKLEKALAAMDLTGDLEARTSLETELRQARKELAHFRAVLESKKEKPRI